MTDFIIVGQGLAACVLMHRFNEAGINFITIANPTLSSCSQVAGGIWNPVVFKRMTKSWMADELVPNLLNFYRACEKNTGNRFVWERTIVKPFVEEQEKNLWLKKSKNELAGFLHPDVVTALPQDLINCNLSGSHGLVNQAGYLDMPAFLDSTTRYFAERLVTETFDYSQLEIKANSLHYKSIIAENIVFCEGFLVKDNPFFNWIPLKPAKGEVLSIEAPELQLNDCIFNRNGFILKMANQHFKIGATYAWNDLEQKPTAAGGAELGAKLKQLIRCNYTLKKHEAGIRPASVDRRPVIGPHPVLKNLHVFNGLGTKGVMLAPYFAENFVHFYLQKAALNHEVNVKRFYRLYEEETKK